MKKTLSPKIFFRETLGSREMNNNPVTVPDAPLNTVYHTPDRLGAQRALDEAGDKAISILTSLLSEGGALERFLSDSNTYKAIADGWLSDRIPSGLIERFKQNIILPMYRQQGWNITIDRIGVGFDRTHTVHNLPVMNIVSKGTNNVLLARVNMNNGGQTLSVSVPSRLEFDMMPPSVQGVISQMNIPAQKPLESRPDLSFFDLPPEQNTQGKGFMTIVNAFNDGFANRARESVRIGKILDNTSLIARLWNTSELSLDQRVLFAKSLVSGPRFSGNGYTLTNQTRPEGNGFLVEFEKTSLSPTEKQKKDQLLQERLQTSWRNTEKYGSLINAIVAIDRNIGQKTQVYVNSDNWRNVL